MHRLKAMKETLASCIQTQLMDIAHVDAHELGEVVDMLKDIEESIYYCARTKALEDEKEEREEMKKKFEQMERERPNEIYYFYSPCQHAERDMDRGMGRMYYSDRQGRNSMGEFTEGHNGRSGMRDTSFAGRGRRNYEERGMYDGRNWDYTEREMPMDFRDSREGRSPMSRRNYMESKEMHKDKDKKLKELERYMKELSEDIIEMIEDASPEERQMLEKKMTNLASKVAQLNTNA